MRTLLPLAVLPLVALMVAMQPSGPAAVRLATSTGPASAGPARAPSAYVLPVGPPLVVLRPFRPPPFDAPWLPGHRGVDLAAAPGSPVRSTAAGTVTFAGPLAGRGVVAVTSGPLRWTYEPVLPAVRVGAQVTAGATIGRLEPATGHCGVRSCLHWGLLRGRAYLDPLAPLGPLARRVRLLPLAHGPTVEPLVAGGAAGARPTAAVVAGRPGGNPPGGPSTGLAVGLAAAGGGGAAAAGALLARARARRRSGMRPRGP
jgi:hypothetical protein